MFLPRETKAFSFFVNTTRKKEIVPKSCSDLNAERNKLRRSWMAIGRLLVGKECGRGKEMIVVGVVWWQVLIADHALSGRAVAQSADQLRSGTSVLQNTSAFPTPYGPLASSRTYSHSFFISFRDSQFPTILHHAIFTDEYLGCVGYSLYSYVVFPDAK